MADFVKVMNKFNKMCSNGCENCDLVNCIDEARIDPENFERTVMRWQEPIYPTIFEVLQTIADEIPNGRNMPLHELIKHNFPANKAKEFGIMPLNVCGLTKYVTEEDNDN